MVRMSESYGTVEPQYVSLRNELESHRRTASFSITLAIGAAVFAAVFIVAFLVV